MNNEFLTPVFKNNKNVICVPFAFKKGFNTGENIKGDVISVYLKNACVALCSAKYFNPLCEVIFATNLEIEQIPKEYINVMSRFNVSIVNIPFDCFTFHCNYLWSLAFYKLCVLKFFMTKDFANICYLDSDVFVQSSLDPVWEECGENIMLYDINHGLQVEDYNIIIKEFEEFFGGKKLLTHYGGEFFAASCENSKIFVNSLEIVYDAMIKRSFVTTKGDEFIISIAANDLRNKIKNAGAYVYRFWTAPGHRVISTCYEYNPFAILHLPNEKNKGMLRLYDRYISKGIIPKKQIIWKMCRLSRLGFFDYIKKRLKKLMMPNN